MDGMQKSINQCFCIRLLILVGVVLGLSSDAGAFGDKYAGEFLKIGMGVREMSLGGATVAAPAAVAAVYWNPAGLAGNQQLSGQLMHTEEFGGILNIDQVTIALPARGKTGYGLGFFRVGVDDIPDTRGALIDYNDNGVFDEGDRLDFGRIGRFGASENALFFSLAKKLQKEIYGGATLKGIYRSLGPTSAWGLGFDIALLYYPFRRLYLGASLLDATTTLIFYPDGTREMVTPTLRLGGGYRLELISAQLMLMPLMAFDIGTQGNTNQSALNWGFLTANYRLGLEARIKQHINIRIGRDDLGGVHIGFGLRTALGNLDYGLAMGGSYRELGQSHRIGLTLHFLELGNYLKAHL